MVTTNKIEAFYLKRGRENGLDIKARESPLQKLDWEKYDELFKVIRKEVEGEKKVSCEKEHEDFGGWLEQGKLKPSDCNQETSHVGLSLASI